MKTLNILFFIKPYHESDDIVIESALTIPCSDKTASYIEAYSAEHGGYYIDATSERRIRRALLSIAKLMGGTLISFIVSRIRDCETIDMGDKYTTDWNEFHDISNNDYPIFEGLE